MPRIGLCGKFHLPRKKSAVGFGSPPDHCDESRSSTADLAAFLFAPPVLAARMGGRKPCRFTPVVAGLPTCSCRRHRLEARAAVCQTDRLEAAVPKTDTFLVTVIHACQSARALSNHQRAFAALAQLLQAPPGGANDGLAHVEVGDLQAMLLALNQAMVEKLAATEDSLEVVYQAALQLDLSAKPEIGAFGGLA